MAWYWQTGGGGLVSGLLEDYCVISAWVGV
jgi:hypothetical protein